MPVLKIDFKRVSLWYFSSVVLTFILCGCSIEKIGPYDDELSPEGHMFLKRNGLIPVPENWLSEFQSVAKYQRYGGSVQFAGSDNECKEIAPALLCMVTLSLIPCPCGMAVLMSRVGSQGETIYYRKNYKDELFGWWVPILALSPNWQLTKIFGISVSSINPELIRRREEKAILSIINEMANEVDG